MEGKGGQGGESSREEGERKELTVCIFEWLTLSWTKVSFITTKVEGRFHKQHRTTSKDSSWTFASPCGTRKREYSFFFFGGTGGGVRGSIAPEFSPSEICVMAVLRGSGLLSSLCFLEEPSEAAIFFFEESVDLRTESETFFLEPSVALLDPLLNSFMGRGGRSGLSWFSGAGEGEGEEPESVRGEVGGERETSVDLGERVSELSGLLVRSSLEGTGGGRCEGGGSSR
jgi:hypothetical protein